ncbi:MAG: NfeD family protein [Bacillota bacterium]|nr:NfeD family protein [Bacillota bacterium]
MELTNELMWIIAAIVFVIIECFSVSLITIWFGIGALCAAIASLITDNLYIQVLIFLAVSLLMLVLVKPIARKHFNGKIEKTNTDALIGCEAIVTEEIGDEKPGRVNVDGKLWRAKSAENVCHNRGDKVLIQKIEGVTLIVKAEEE